MGESKAGLRPARQTRAAVPYANHLRRPVKLAVHIRIAQDGLHVFAGFGEGDGLDELLRIAGVALSQPVSYAVAAGIVGGQRIFELSVLLVDHIFEVAGAEFEVHGRRGELRRGVSLELDLFGGGLARLRSTVDT